MKNEPNKYSIPITWVAAAYIPTTSFVLGVALWVYTVNSRLARIESKLGIVPYSAKADFVIKDADAKEK